MSNIYTVKVKIHEETMNKINKISGHLKSENKADVIAQCVNLGDKVMTEILSGSNVIVERRDGSKVEYTF